MTRIQEVFLNMLDVSVEESQFGNGTDGGSTIWGSARYLNPLPGSQPVIKNIKNIMPYSE